VSSESAAAAAAAPLLAGVMDVLGRSSSDELRSQSRLEEALIQKVMFGLEKILKEKKVCPN
jgi:hypothetical protein